MLQESFENENTRKSKIKTRGIKHHGKETVLKLVIRCNNCVYLQFVGMGTHFKRVSFQGSFLFDSFGVDTIQKRRQSPGFKRFACISQLLLRP